MCTNMDGKSVTDGNFIVAAASIFVNERYKLQRECLFHKQKKILPSRNNITKTNRRQCNEVEVDSLKTSLQLFCSIILKFYYSHEDSLTRWQCEHFEEHVRTIQFEWPLVLADSCSDCAVSYCEGTLTECCFFWKIRFCFRYFFFDVGTEDSSRSQSAHHDKRNIAYVPISVHSEKF